MNNKKRLYQDKLTVKSRVKRLLWNITYKTVFRFSPRFMFHKWRIFLLRTFGAKIGFGCKVDPTCFIWAPWNLEMGDFVCLAGATDIYTVDHIKIGSNVAISQRAFVCTASHDISSLDRPLIHSAIEIHDNAWVCAESFIGGGVIINEGAVVAARAVVTKDVVSWAVVAGNPARFIKKRIIVEKPDLS